METLYTQDFICSCKTYYKKKIEHIDIIIKTEE